MMFSEPRNWKWMVPSSLTVLFVALYGMVPPSWGEWAYVPLGMAAVCGLAGALNFWLYLDVHVMQSRIDMMNARNSTPEVRIAEAMRQMHPDAVRALTAHQRSVWQLQYIPAKDIGDWTYKDAPNVHAGFVEFVLDHSNWHSGDLMRKSILSQGSKQFDPTEQVTDYQQYDDLLALMERKMMITRAIGNQPPKFLPPYDEQRIRHFFLLDDDGSYESDEKTMAMKRAAEEMARSVESIPAPKAIPQMPAENQPEPTHHPVGMSARVEREPGLTDEQVRNIQAENERYASVLRGVKQ